jgi:hypothetical protein
MDPNIFINFVIFTTVSAVLSTRRLGLGNWQWWAVIALVIAAELLGAAP